MSRGITSAMITAIAAGTVYPILFGEFDFSGGTIYVNNGPFPVTWNAHTWVGLGKFVSVQPIRETADVNANNVSFVLNGVDSALIAELFGNRSRGRWCYLWLGCFNSSGTLLADPQMVFAGRMDQPVINDQGQTASINLSAESRLVDLQRPRERRYTDQDQKAYYPTDTFFMFVAGLQDRQIQWGSGGGNSDIGPAGNGSGPTAGPTGSGPSNNSGPYYGNNTMSNGGTFTGTNGLGQDIRGLGGNPVNI